MQLKEMEIEKTDVGWDIDIHLELGTDVVEYWGLETKDEVEDFLHFMLKPT